MFNNLNDTNQQSRAAVDDIFAETDKVTPPSAGSSAATPSAGVGIAGTDIETHRVGLTGDELMDEPEAKGSGKWFKIVLIAIVAAILILSGYLAYSKFFKAEPATESLITPVEETPIVEEPIVKEVEANKPGTSVQISGGASGAVTTETPVVSGSETPVVSGSETPVVETPAAVPAKTVDSDSDGLTDAEEQAAGTNINIIDTDGDGLSDYEEVNVYKTNPLSTDTDGDTYLDGAEVKGGYNPNGAGRMPKA